MTTRSTLLNSMDTITVESAPDGVRLSWPAVTLTGDQARRLARQLLDSAETESKIAETSPPPTPLAIPSRTVNISMDPAESSLLFFSSESVNRSTPAERLGHPLEKHASYRLSRSARETIERLDLDVTDVFETANNPEMRWPTENKAGDIRVRGEMTCVVFPDMVTGAWNFIATILVRSGSTSGSRGRRGTPKASSGGRKRSFPDTQKALMRTLAEKGFDTAPSGGGHLKITHPDHPGKALICPSTPSDHRFLLAINSKARRLFGIELFPLK